MGKIAIDYDGLERRRAWDQRPVSLQREQRAVYNRAMIRTVVRGLVVYAGWAAFVTWVLVEAVGPMR